MRKKLYLSLIVAVFIAVAGFAVITFSTAAEPMSRKIVVFQPNALNEAAKDKLIARVGGVKIKNLDLIGSKAVYLPSKAAEKALARQAGVLRIENDIAVEALVRATGKSTPPQPLETLTWGIDRIDAEKIWNITTGDPIKVAIVDTGIDVKHPDLTDNLKGGFSAVDYTSNYNDDNGHGTHVAGITAAADNNIGVIGVGPKIDLYAVKVLNRRGSGYLSDVIEGLNWSIQNNMQVINMSLGTSIDSPSFHEAIQKVYQAGIVQIVAAGNNGATVNYPAAYPEVIAVSATDQNDNLASWSSRGPEVDLSAPGVSIYSTYKGQTYQTLSGTSMAAPHVTGAAALVLTTPVGAYDLDADGLWDPIEVYNKLTATAEDLGLFGRDDLYGFGLVDAEAAVIR